MCYASVCVCVRARLCTRFCMCAGMCVHLCVCSCEGPKLTLRIFSHLPSTLFFGAGAHWYGWSSWPGCSGEIPYLYLLGLELQAGHHTDPTHPTLHRCQGSKLQSSSFRNLSELVMPPQSAKKHFISQWNFKIHENSGHPIFKISVWTFAVHKSNWAPWVVTVGEQFPQSFSSSQSYLPNTPCMLRLCPKRPEIPMNDLTPWPSS